MRRIRILNMICLLGLAASCASKAPSGGAGAAHEASSSSPPRATKGDAADVLHGTRVSDPYRALENADDPATRAWTEAQAKRTRAYLDSLPNHAAIRDQLVAWAEFQAPAYRVLLRRGGTWFALKSEPPKAQPVIVTFERFEKTDDGVGRTTGERVVVDPNKIDAKGLTAIDFFEPSLDGKLVAVSLSKAGSEIGDVRVFKVADGSATADEVSLVNKPTAGGSLAWTNDGFYYTRYPRAGERPAPDLDFYQQIWFHKIGAPGSQDAYSLGREFPRIAEAFLESTDDGRFVLANVLNGDGGEAEHFVRGPGDSGWTQLTRFSDKAKQGALSENGDVYFESTKRAPRGRILKASYSRKSKILVPFAGEREGALRGVAPVGKFLYAIYSNGGPTEIRSFKLDEKNGKDLGRLATDPLSSVGGMTKGENGKMVFHARSYVRPVSWDVYDPTSKTIEVALRRRVPVSFSDVETKRIFAKSKDGTQIPMTVLVKKGTKLDGTGAAFLTGYGGYNISMDPWFQPDFRLWLDRGGAVAIANLRGGGEFGEPWHLAGNLTKKQNVFDDFAACAKKLIADGYAAPKRLAIEGRSNGGLLMGAAFTQHPELFGAVASGVGIYDMIRVENDANGAFNVTEFGTVKNADQFRALYAYSPYHHVKDGQKYPAILLSTGANDGRVAPYHSKKMAARLQEASPDAPVYLRVDYEGGHGMGAGLRKRAEEQADVYSFLLANTAKP